MTPEQMNQRIAATLEAMRIEQHRSLKSLAKVAGCSPATLRRKLDGKNLTAVDAVVIAHELGESLAGIVERIEDEAPVSSQQRVSRRIRDRLDALGLTHRWLAVQLCWSPATLSRVLSGITPMNLVDVGRIANVLDLDPFELVGSQ